MDRRGLLVLAMVGAVLFFGRLGAASLWDIDESSNATAAVEMLTSGDYLVPTLAGELRTDKPPLHYWSMTVAYRVFGIGAFGARFFAALLGLLTVLLVAVLGGRILGPPAGMTAGLILAVSFLFTVSSRSATTDAFLVLFTNLAVLTGFFADRSRRWALASWGSMGLAVLAKGPVGVVLPAAALGLYHLARRRQPAGLLVMADPAGIALFAAIALPWYMLAGLATGGDLLSGFFLKHNVGRFLTTMESHRGPFYYYLVLLLPAFYPWAAFLPPSLAAAWRGRKAADDRAAFAFLMLVWAGLVILFFSLARTKLPTYMLPAFPALALLVAAWAHGADDDAPGVRLRGVTASWVATLVIGLLWPALFGVLFTVRMPDLLPWTVLALPLAAAAVPGLVRHARGLSTVGSLRRAAAVAAVGAALIHMILVPLLEPYRLAPAVGRTVAARAREGDRVARLGYFRPSLLFYGRRPLERMTGPGDVEAFVSDPAGRFLITTAGEFGRLPERLRGGLAVIRQGQDAADSNQVILLLERMESGGSGT